MKKIAIGLVICLSLFFISKGFGLYIKNHNAPEVKQHNKVNEMNANHYEKIPSTKIPPISSVSAPLLQSLLERIWVTKYIGANSEIYGFAPNMPLCETLTDVQIKQDDKNGVFIWWNRCLPLKVQIKKNKEGLNGLLVIRMLDFRRSSDVIEEAFEIIRTDSLGSYEISNDKIDAIKNMIILERKNQNINGQVNYRNKLRTYSILEDRFFLEGESTENSGVTTSFEYSRQYFAYWGKKNALSIDYNSMKPVKKQGVIEFSIPLPASFFRMNYTQIKESISE